MFKLIKQTLKDTRGESPLTFPIAALLVVMLLYTGVDILSYYSVHQKLRTAASETLTLMKMENGWDTTTDLFFHNMIQSVGLQSYEITTDETTPKPVQRGDLVTISVRTEYEVKSLKPLNKTIKIPVQIELSGLAQDFIRWR